MTLNCAVDITLYPMRLAGTCSRYSKNAINHETSMACQIAELECLRCAYQAIIIIVELKNSDPIDIIY